MVRISGPRAGTTTAPYRHWSDLDGPDLPHCGLMRLLKCSVSQIAMLIAASIAVVPLEAQESTATRRAERDTALSLAVESSDIRVARGNERKQGRLAEIRSDTLFLFSNRRFSLVRVLSGDQSLVVASQSIPIVQVDSVWTGRRQTLSGAAIS